MSSSSSTCALCPFRLSERACRKPEGKGPENCPTSRQSSVRASLDEALNDPRIFEFARQASLQESSAYADRDRGYDLVRGIKPRIAETMEFAVRMNFSRLGLVFCMGLHKEAAIVHRILDKHGFEVVSVICKVGRVPKAELELGRKDQVDMQAEMEPMCNPIAQAAIVNQQKTDFNILLGLCVGHDSLFMKQAEAMCTVLAVKDRLLGHNPLAAIYTYDSYSRYLKDPGLLKKDE